MSGHNCETDVPKEGSFVNQSLLVDQGIGIAADVPCLFCGVLPRLGSFSFFWVGKRGLMNK